jgi:hypothetical protein
VATTATAARVSGWDLLGEILPRLPANGSLLVVVTFVNPAVEERLLFLAVIFRPDG